MTALVILDRSAVNMIESAIRELNDYRGDANYFLSLIWHTNVSGDPKTRRMGLGVYDRNVSLNGLAKIATVRGIDVYCQLPEAETSSMLRITGNGKSMFMTAT